MMFCSRAKKWWRKFLSFVGSGFLVSLAYLDPGNFFCTGNAVGVLPVGNITYKDKRYASYLNALNPNCHFHQSMYGYAWTTVYSCGELGKSFLWNPFFPIHLEDTLFHVLQLLSKHLVKQTAYPRAIWSSSHRVLMETKDMTEKVRGGQVVINVSGEETLKGSEGSAPKEAETLHPKQSAQDSAKQYV
ncbi:putative AMP-activated protein kinase, gamma regulatory subunit [Corchorus olitorius]|uniref:AMP-activated protein kinase, gamma regulatory subunit n=1 Tax=Corchorus olitorius TaxID=93759 RepID=A0A1R3G838_9ROSI|nr:putative AMP-activated protein kinase, gamma regulatory subunit [Corchorus olitorius]